MPVQVAVMRQMRAFKLLVAANLVPLGLRLVLTLLRLSEEVRYLVNVTY